MHVFIDFGIINNFNLKLLNDLNFCSIFIVPIFLVEIPKNALPNSLQNLSQLQLN